MKFYQNVKRDITPPIDLSVLGNTYNTLQQGHIKAVELGSQLRTQIANLPLNEKESQFKEELGNEIERVIEGNSIGGNAYYALDELIKAQGDIARNPELINKLQAQADYKSYIDAIDNNKELTGDMKEYYKEINPYKNGDILDKDGNKVGYDNTFKWQATKNPTKVFDINEFIVKGIKLASPDYIDYNSTTFVDANGNVTRDPLKALDGQVFYTVNGQREILSKEKIIESINNVINSTPGARESIQQDYDVALWKYKKNQEAGLDSELLNSPIVDANGSLLTPQQYMDSLISRAASISAYVKGGPKTTYNSNLAAQRAAYLKNGVRNGTTKGNSVKQEAAREFYFRGNNNFNLVVTRNLGKEYTEQKNAAVGALAELGFDYKSKTFEDDIKQAISDPNISSDIKKQIKSLYREYEFAVNGLQSAKSNLSESDADKLDFGLRITGGERPDANKTKYDKDYQRFKNRILDDDGNVIINIDKQDYDNLSRSNVFTELAQNSNNAVKLVNNNGRYSLQIIDNGNIDDYLMQVASLYKNSRRETIGGSGPQAPGLSPHPVYNSFNSGKTRRNLDRLVKLYENAERYSHINGDIVRNNNVEGVTSLISLSDKSFEGFAERVAAETGLSDRTDSQINTLDELSAQSILNTIQNGLKPDFYNIYKIDDLENSTEARMINSEQGLSEYISAASDMAQAANAGFVTLSPARSAMDDLGYIVTTYSGTNKDSRVIKNRYFVSGLGVGEATKQLFNDAQILSGDIIERVNKFNDAYTILSSLETPRVGAIYVSKDENNPSRNIFHFGNIETESLQKENAQTVTYALLKYREIYDNLESGNYTTEDLQVWDIMLEDYIYPILSSALLLPQENIKQLFEL